MYVGMSELEREHNDLAAALQHLLTSKEQGEHTGFPQNPYRWCMAMARIRQAEGDLDEALNMFQGQNACTGVTFPQCAPRHSMESARVDCAGQVERSARLGK